MFNVRVEYEGTPIRHIAVQCPNCNRWFHGRDIVKARDPFDALGYAHDISWAEFECPVCKERFGGLQHNDGPSITEVGYPEVYEDCLERKVVETWE